ncbi:hypothetical protein LTR37_011243 [Vermiconidia calcicola]|uniref:Uncharacterized protein n=1 Tax=Vermiconidia calcicola TaxID=1690605 RepID=A0ACC3N4F0_9PEZI|nr:hypothetical protein LTR37_011243 [Vermiconidia calcicola]
MAPPARFDPQDTIVSVKCHHPPTSTPYFHIHETLLYKAAAVHNWRRSSAHENTFELNVPWDGFRHFALWLYTGKCDEENLSADCWIDSTNELLHAHEVGRKLGCVDFQDTVVDALTTKLTDCKGNLICDILGDFLKEFPFQSIGRQLLVDVIAYGPAENGMSNEEDKRFDYNALKSVDDSHFTIVLSREILASRGFQVPLNLTEELMTMLVCGFLEIKSQGDSVPRREMPWITNPCRYHRHTELGLPCYKSKQ